MTTELENVFKEIKKSHNKGSKKEDLGNKNKENEKEDEKKIKKK